ncbi:hypothetical protein P167DRAFT_254207 [Morchella conica CCBAS932]|uniref:Uncharacterized protein n=1 Tax=Morchella conica CCBAS932 TaxID=1392247 RepID=A0A3N4KIN2_9PEZI|nr:hypothetical protein P167DRAFT_254207 [Morchella conica CCBAS932]
MYSTLFSKQGSAYKYSPHHTVNDIHHPPSPVQNLTTQSIHDRGPHHRPSLDGQHQANKGLQLHHKKAYSNYSTHHPSCGVMIGVTCNCWLTCHSLAPLARAWLRVYFYSACTRPHRTAELAGWQGRANAGRGSTYHNGALCCVRRGRRVREKLREKS